MKPHEFLEEVRKLRAYKTANPGLFPDIDDRYCIDAAITMIEYISANRVITVAREARGRPVGKQHAVLLRFPPNPQPRLSDDGEWSDFIGNE